MQKSMWRRGLAVAAAGLCGLILTAAYTPGSFITVQSILAPPAQITNATGSAVVTVIDATSGNPVKLIGLICSNTDTVSAYDLRVSLLKGGVTYPLTTVNIPISAGAVGGATPVPPVAVLTTTNIPGLAHDSEGNAFLYVDTAVIEINTLTTVASGKVVSCLPLAGKF